MQYIHRCIYIYIHMYRYIVFECALHQDNMDNMISLNTYIYKIYEISGGS